jgi:uncharacterized protein (DUF4415 family)
MKKTLPSEQFARLEALAKVPPEGIDTSDIPEMPDSAVLYSRGGRIFRPVKQPVTIRLDADVVGWFKDHAGDRPYQAEINRVLRRHVTDAMKRKA